MSRNRQTKTKLDTLADYNVSLADVKTYIKSAVKFFPGMQRHEIISKVRDHFNFGNQVNYIVSEAITTLVQTGQINEESKGTKMTYPVYFIKKQRRASSRRSPAKSRTATPKRSQTKNSSAKRSPPKRSPGRISSPKRSATRSAKK